MLKDRFKSMFGARQGDGNRTSFLPADYLTRKADTHANIVSLTLFGIVLFGVVGAFFVTNRAWNAVRAQQLVINQEYTEQTKKIEQLKKLEAQKSEMLDKAEITTALIERVPRSILLAELVNRMPDRLSLTEFVLTSKRVVEAAPQKTGTGAKSIAKSAGSAGAKGGAKGPPPRPRPPKMEFALTLTGLSATDEAVADFQAALKDCALLARVDLVSSVEATVDNQTWRRFKIEAQLHPDADARKIEPLQVPRLGGLLEAAVREKEPEKAEPKRNPLSRPSGRLSGVRTDPPR